ncbi:hypothetical protein B9Z55_027049 [Caenorhabditis nigoni]|nr:hypothetical protein B9Z55_027049 [Caenorhabditis nigoni]
MEEVLDSHEEIKMIDGSQELIDLLIILADRSEELLDMVEERGSLTNIEKIHNQLSECFETSVFKFPESDIFKHLQPEKTKIDKSETRVKVAKSVVKNFVFENTKFVNLPKSEEEEIDSNSTTVCASLKYIQKVFTQELAHLNSHAKSIASRCSKVLNIIAKYREDAISNFSEEKFRKLMFLDSKEPEINKLLSTAKEASEEYEQGGEASESIVKKMTRYTDEMVPLELRTALNALFGNDDGGESKNRIDAIREETSSIVSKYRESIGLSETDLKIWSGKSQILEMRKRENSELSLSERLIIRRFDELETVFSENDSSLRLIELFISKSEQLLGLYENREHQKNACKPIEEVFEYLGTLGYEDSDEDDGVVPTIEKTRIEDPETPESESEKPEVKSPESGKSEFDEPEVKNSESATLKDSEDKNSENSIKLASEKSDLKNSKNSESKNSEKSESKESKIKNSDPKTSEVEKSESDTLKDPEVKDSKNVKSEKSEKSELEKKLDILLASLTLIDKLYSQETGNLVALAKSGHSKLSKLLQLISKNRKSIENEEFSVYKSQRMALLDETESQIQDLFSIYENSANFHENEQKSNEKSLKTLPYTPEDLVPWKLRTAVDTLFDSNFEGDPMVLMNTIRQETDSLELPEEEQQKSVIFNPLLGFSDIDEYIAYFCVLSIKTDKLLGLIDKRKDMKSSSESIDGFFELLESLDNEDSDEDDDTDNQILASTINLLGETFLQKLDQKIAENEGFFKKLEILIPLAQKVQKRQEDNLAFKKIVSDFELLKSETENILENHQKWRKIGPEYLENMNSSCNFEVTKTNESVQKILEKMMEKGTEEEELEILKKSLNEEIDLLFSKWKGELDMPDILMDDDKPELTEKINNLSPGIRELVNHLNILWQIKTQFLRLFEDEFFGKNEIIEKYITMLSLDEEDKNLDLERKILEKSEKSENPEKWKKLKNAIEILRQFDQREHRRNVRETQSTLENIQNLILEIPKKREFLIKNSQLFKTKNQQIEYSKNLKILDTAESFFKENVLESIESFKDVPRDSEDVDSGISGFEGLENLQNALNEYLKTDFERSEENIENLKKSIIQETEKLISDCSENSENSEIFEILRKSQNEVFKTFDFGCSIQMMLNFMKYLENAFSFISEDVDDGSEDSEKLNDYMGHVFKSLGIKKDSGDSEDVENSNSENLDCEKLKMPEDIKEPENLEILHKKAVPQNPDSTDYVGYYGPGEFDEFMKIGQVQGKNQHEWIQFVLRFIGAITVLSIPIYLIFSIWIWIQKLIFY